MNGAPERGPDGTPEGALHEGIVRAIWSADPKLAERLDRDPGAHLDLISLAEAASHEVDRVLLSSIRSARQAGNSWGRIGARLGMSRQAAQQRFGPALGEVVPGPDRTRRLAPLTAFNEMEALAAAGRHGWHSVGFGMLYHDLELTSEQWEHLRVPAFTRDTRELEAGGWRRIGGMWFPWAYYARPLGVPPEPER